MLTALWPATKGLGLNRCEPGVSTYAYTRMNLHVPVRNGSAPNFGDPGSQSSSKMRTCSRVLPRSERHSLCPPHPPPVAILGPLFVPLAPIQSMPYFIFTVRLCAQLISSLSWSLSGVRPLDHSAVSAHLLTHLSQVWPVPELPNVALRSI